MALLFAVATPVMAFVGSVLGQLLNRRAAKELEQRSRREETLRTLRWAAELAIAADDRRSEFGASQLDALGRSDLLDVEQRVFVDAASAWVARDLQARTDQVRRGRRVRSEEEGNP